MLTIIKYQIHEKPVSAYGYLPGYPCSIMRENKKTFLVSGYTTGNNPDVMLCTIDGKGSARMVSEFIAGDNPSYFTFGENNLVYFVNEVDSFNHGPGWRDHNIAPVIRTAIR